MEFEGDEEVEREFDAIVAPLRKDETTWRIIHLCAMTILISVVVAWTVALGVGAVWLVKSVL